MRRLRGAERSSRRPRASGDVRVGLGDDAAVLKLDGDREWVLSCDASIEDVHFRLATHPADSVGYKSLMRAASDLAAMGAQPRYFLLTISLPAKLTGRWLDDFLRGMARAARSLGIRAIGGDTTSGANVSIDVTVIGELASGRAVTRSGARIGDYIYVSGKLGRAELGLELTLAGRRPDAVVREFVVAHLYPKARIELGAWLAKRGVASAMMDLSDGFSTDLARLCKASGVGARIERAVIPRVRIPADAAKKLAIPKVDPLYLALHGGEDYELLFTVPERKLKLLRRAPGFSRLAQIGRIIRGNKVLLRHQNGTESPLRAAGWDSFSKKSSK